MQRIHTAVLTALLAGLVAFGVQAQTTLLVEGEVFCASNGVEVPIPGACADLAVVSPEIVGVTSGFTPSTFSARLTLPTQTPQETSPSFFLNQTRYVVPTNGGEFDVSVEMFGLGEDFHFAPNGQSLPFPPHPSDDLVVSVANDETFFFLPPPGVDLWSVASVGNNAAIAGTHMCDIFFSSPSASNIDSQDYFVPAGSEGPVEPWFPRFRCQAIFPTGSFPPFSIVPVLSAAIHTVTRIEVADIDLKPESDPNCVNPSSKGVTSVAILGSEQLDVQDIDADSLTFGGASGVKCAFEDSLPSDGILDLACRYKVSQVEWPAQGSDCGDVLLEGSLLDGTPLEGSDLACITGESTCEAATAP